MIRTFHTKPARLNIIATMTPWAVMAFYFLWIKMSLIALVFILVLLLLIERLLHTIYQVGDDYLLVSRGRFSKQRVYSLIDIDEVKLMKCSKVMLFKPRHVVVCEFKDGRLLVITPFPAQEFCNIIHKNMQKLERKD